jgi:hypothetical protein
LANLCFQFFDLRAKLGSAAILCFPFGKTMGKVTFFFAEAYIDQTATLSSQ